VLSNGHSYRDEAAFFLGDGGGERASGEDILAVEHDVIPLDWADAFQQERSIPFATVALHWTENQEISHICQ